MAGPQKTWTAVLFCRACERKFTVSKILTEEISEVSDTVACPNCPAGSIQERHDIVSMKAESG